MLPASALTGDQISSPAAGWRIIITTAYMVQMSGADWRSIVIEILRIGQTCISEVFGLNNTQTTKMQQPFIFHRLHQMTKTNLRAPTQELITLIPSNKQYTHTT